MKRLLTFTFVFLLLATVANAQYYGYNNYGYDDFSASTKSYESYSRTYDYTQSERVNSNYNNYYGGYGYYYPRSNMYGSSYSYSNTEHYSESIKYDSYQSYYRSQDTYYPRSYGGYYAYYPDYNPRNYNRYDYYGNYRRFY